ncbi:hypothetical protein CFOL_v3_05977 [Cephalotus follicularis]|uniref:UBN2 domain-containing protein n=1 Tax=Cephalotus follicularis TaxID=3775 RepID=A0A1Q3B3J4_CEPFO|nr:hypothetical protein CFOL_v3_05977 [Cephalotus follicularis]
MVKLDKFDGNNYTCGKDKMLFLLTALKISYILDPSLEPIPEEPAASDDGTQPSALEIEQIKTKRQKREEDELLCRGHILDTLSNRLYDLFTGMQTAKEI